jgi:hypothetical protein
MSKPSIKRPRLDVEYVPVTAVQPDPQNARKHSKRQIVQLKASIEEFGFTNPILVDGDLKVIAGHGRLEAAKRLRMETVPCVQLRHLSEPQKAALAIADNRLTDLSKFDPEALTAQLKRLCEIDFPIELTGFDPPKISMALTEPVISAGDPADNVVEPPPDPRPVCQSGDLWLLGDHKVLVADGLDPSSYARLLAEHRAEMVFADPFQKVAEQRLSASETLDPDELAMAGEERSSPPKRFLFAYMSQLVRWSVDGSIHFHCTDWRHLPEILEAGSANYDELNALCVWNKTNVTKGALYPSKHELVLAYKNGTAPSFNNSSRKRHKLQRTDVWTFSEPFQSGRGSGLNATIKPVSLIAEAIWDCSTRGAIILDPFAGAGTTMLAAERTGRRAAAIEADPCLVDVAIRRWQAMTGEKAVLAGAGETFEAVQAVRLSRVARS